MKTALITGISGQDGSYLAELLAEKGYRVIGALRNPETFKRESLCLSNSIHELVRWSMLDQGNMAEVLTKHRPTEMYNLGAFSSGAGMYDDPVGIGEVNGISITRMLEAIRQTDMNIRFCQASSSEMYGEAVESPQTEETAFRPRSPYGAAKAYAHEMVRIYRRHYRLFACASIFFNHESPRRGLEFVTRRVAHEAARIKLGLSNELRLGNLEARRDWGFAGDYVYAMWRMLQQSEPDDYVIATGETHTVRELCDTAFGYLELDYRDYVREDTSLYRMTEEMPLVGNPSKARRQLGWVPRMCFRDLIHMMVDADMRRLRKNIGNKGMDIG